METHNTREEIEEIEHQAKKHIASLLGYLQQIHDGGQYRCAEMELEKVLENVELLTKTLHQQLQKARHDWLREEIVKLKGEKIETLPSALEDTTGFLLGHAKNITLQTIIDRYQAELDQDKV